jgi:HAD superfamily hydrolase (TIGR01509 family)
MQDNRWTFIFDVEGTLVDCAEPIIRSWQDTLGSFGHSFSYEQVHRLSGMDANDMLAKLLPATELAHTGAQILLEQTKRYHEVYRPHVRAFPGVKTLFEQLKDAGHRIALGTTCAQADLDCYYPLLGVRDLVDAVACGDDVCRGKPHPDLFESVLQQLRPSKLRHVLVIGDTPYDAEAARKVGVRAIGTTTGGFTQTELENAGCVAVCLGPHELAEYLSNPAAVADQFAF